MHFWAQTAPALSASDGYAGIDGFLPFGRGSVMLDVVFLAMFVVVPLLAVSIWLVKYRRRHLLHKRLQLAMAAVLLVAVALFEIDLQLFTEWELRAAPSPYFDPARKWTCPAGISLLVHLCFAVPTLALWVVVVTQALRKFPRSPAPGPHSRWHARWGMLAAGGMLFTAITGWVFYWLAFVAT
jgi:putative membrane protein